MNNTWRKYPEDNRTGTISYARTDEIEAGDTIASAVVTVAPTGLTVGSPTVTASTVKVNVSGGTSGIEYILSVVATTAAGKIIGERVPVKVI